VGMVRLDAQRRLVVLDGLSQLALPRERRTHVAVSLSMVRLETQGRLILIARLSQLALLGKQRTSVVVALSIVRVETKRRLVMRHRLSQLALLSGPPAPAVLTARGSGVNRNGMAPEFLRVVPDVDLVPGERCQAEEEKKSEPGRQEREPSRNGKQGGTGQERPSEACQVGIAISGNLRAALKDPEYRQEDHDVSHPRRRQARRSPAQGQGDRSESENHAVAQDERHRRWIQGERPFVERREVQGHDHLPEVEAQAVG